MGKWTQAAIPVKEKLDMIDAAGGIYTRTAQSDKVGSDWVSYFVNDILVKREYVAQENPVGTADNPFGYARELPLVPNGFYTLDGVRKVWTGEFGVAAAWDDERFTVF